MSIAIPRINDTDKACADTFNAPLNVIEQALNTQDEILKSITGREVIVVKDVPTTGKVGQAVYFDAVTGMFLPAYIKADAEAAVSGDYMNMPTACVCGIIVATKSSSVGDIVIAGKFRSKECVAGFNGTAPGTYYLSNVAGELKLDPVKGFQQPVLTYMGDDEFIVNITYQPPYMYNTAPLAGVTASGTVSATFEDGILGISGTVLKQDDAEAIYSATAVATISDDGRTYRTTNIVSNIHKVGEGGTLMKNANGEVYIGLSNEFGSGIEATLYNLNGVKRAENDILTYMVFPGGKSSSITISRHVSTTGELDASVWMHNIGSEVVTATISMYFLQDPVEGSSVPQSPVMLNTVTTSTAVGTNTTDICRSTNKPSGVSQITGDGTIIAKIELKPSNDFKVLRAGFDLTPVIPGDK